jgi:F-type H+-transporting ATPase subunit b
MAETTKAHTEVPAEGHKAPFPPFQKENFATQLFWLAIFFVLLYVIMAKLAIPRIGGILAARQNRIDGDLEQARRLKDQSDETFASYEKALADARGRAQTIAAETRSRLNVEAEQRRKQLDAELNARLGEAEKSIAAAKAAAMTSVRGIAVEAAGAIVERLIGVAPAAAAVKKAVDAALKR